LVDTPAWGAGARKGVQVRVLFWARKKRVRNGSLFYFISIGYTLLLKNQIFYLRSMWEAASDLNINLSFPVCHRTYRSKLLLTIDVKCWKGGGCLPLPKSSDYVTWGMQKNNRTKVVFKDYSPNQILLLPSSFFVYYYLL